jgi:hypothetical protein
MANKVNIAPVVSPEILKTVSSSTAIKTFGDQLKNQAKEKIISVALGKAQQLTNQIVELKTLEIKVGIDHNNEIKRIETLRKQEQISENQYQKAIAIENASYAKKREDIQILKQKLQTDLNNIIADPYRKIKEAKNKRKLARARRKARNRAEKARARRVLAKKVATNAAKTLAPVIALQLSNRLSSVISQRSKLETLVDQVNVYIEQANTPDTISIATNLRNNTVTLINNSISKLDSIRKTLNIISISLTLFNIIIPLLNRTAPLTVITTLPGTPIPGMIPHDELRNKKQRLEKLVSALSAVIVIATNSLENEIVQLNELILRLKNISQQLTDSTLSNLNEQELTDLTNFYSPVGTDEFPPYKGFKFKIKIEENKAFEVKGNKRRYAVAIDRDGVEVIKSELSFTLDPNDLVEQLKLVIDQRNLQG